MNKLKLTFILTALLISFSLLAQDSKRNILTSSIDKEDLGAALLSAHMFTPLPGLNHPAWKEVDPVIREELIANAEGYLDYSWPSLLASTFMEYDKEGNRARYEADYFKRREVLSGLCVAEILENEGRFMKDIINGLWLILEESTWVIPAHSDGNMLHDLNDVTVDLFSAETAGLLAWIDYYFGNSLDEVTPLIRKRLHEEVERRVIQSMLDHNDFWYMGYTGRIPNNWNPWIVSNWLTAVLILEKDHDRRVESVWKAMDVLDHYLNPHPEDGGCDEGPSYWGRAAASLYDCLFLLESATSAEVDIYDVPMIRNMASYIYKIHIADDWFVNFADGSARNKHETGTVYRIGKAINDRTMMSMAAEQFKKTPAVERVSSSKAPFGQRLLPDLLVMKELETYLYPYTPDLEYLLPDLQVAVARENKSNKGFFTTIKGGHNNESHNHNDVGNFVVFYDGLPLLVDAGVGTYTRKTFSNDRYSIWTMQSAYHNLPTLNGEMQKNGRRYQAENFTVNSESNETTTSMDISKAYGYDAYTLYWNREFTMDRKKGEVELTDSWEQEKQLEKNEWHFLTARKPVILDRKTIQLSNGKSMLFLEHARHFFVSVEEIEIDDARLGRVWGERLWRITLTTGKKGLKGKETFTIHP